MGMETPDPWHIADRLGVTIKHTPLNLARAYTNGRNTIWLDPRLTPTEKRCSLYHEIVHILYGHQGHQDPTTELHVRYTVARDLIPFPNLTATYNPHTPPHTIAHHLNVTPHVLHDRLQAFTLHELQTLTLNPAHQWATF